MWKRSRVKYLKYETLLPIDYACYFIIKGVIRKREILGYTQCNAGRVGEYMLPYIREYCGIQRGKRFNVVFKDGGF